VSLEWLFSSSFEAKMLYALSSTIGFLHLDAISALRSPNIFYLKNLNKSLKVKLSRYAMQAPRGRGNIVPTHFFIPRNCIRREWLTSRPGRALPSVLVGQEAGCVSEPVWTPRLEERLPAVRRPKNQWRRTLLASRNRWRGGNERTYGCRLQFVTRHFRESVPSRDILQRERVILRAGNPLNSVAVRLGENCAGACRQTGEVALSARCLITSPAKPTCDWQNASLHWWIDCLLQSWLSKGVSVANIVRNPNSGHECVFSNSLF
jgi:hypothetical protein